MDTRETAEPIHRILVPLDFSPTSNVPWITPVDWQRCTGATLILLHAFDVPDAWGAGGEPSEVDRDLMENSRRCNHQPIRSRWNASPMAVRQVLSSAGSLKSANAI